MNKSEAVEISRIEGSPERTAKALWKVWRPYSDLLVLDQLLGLYEGLKARFLAISQTLAIVFHQFDRK